MLLEDIYFPFDALLRTLGFNVPARMARSQGRLAQPRTATVATVKDLAMGIACRLQEGVNTNLEESGSAFIYPVQSFWNIYQ